MVRTERVCDKLLLILGALILCGLVYYSLRYTEDLWDGTEIPMTVKDNPIWNLLIFAGAVLLCQVIKRKLSGRLHLSGKTSRFFPWIVSAIVLALSLLWVAICHVKAKADGGQLCYIAGLVMEGRFGTMIPPGYMSYNPHQFSLLFVIQLLFKLFGVGNYQAFQYMNALCMPLLFYAGYRIMELSDIREETRVYYVLLFLTNIPVFLYIAYVYGEITSITFTMVLMWQVLRFCKERKKISILWGTLAIVFACIMRMNSLIVLIAAAIVLVVYGVREARPSAIGWIALMLFCIFVSDAAIKNYYENISGNKVLDGIPHISYVRMGLEDGERGPGWYDQSNYEAMIRHDYDTELTAQDEKQEVKARLRQFWEDKTYGIDFFRRKILSQWNSPTYHGFYETAAFNCKKEELPWLIRQIYFDKIEMLKSFVNRYQFVLYLSTAVAVIAALLKRKEERHLEDRILLIAIVGGFLFSIMWEAMSRYVLPYVVYMVPMAAMGMGDLQELISRKITKRRK